MKKLKWKYYKSVDQFCVVVKHARYSWRKYKIVKTKLLGIYILFKGHVEIGRFSTLKKAQRVAQFIHNG